MNRSRLALCLVCLLCFASACSVRAEMGPVVSPDKKLIAWASDQLTAADFRQRVVELEQHVPFDGVVLTVRPDALPDEAGRYTLWFGGKRHTRDQFRQAVADLKAARSSRFTDNFMDLETTVRYEPAPGEANLDWFDPNWSVVADNCAVAAYVAKEGGLKGFFLDVEGYGGGLGPWRYPFSYDDYARLTKEAGNTPRTLDECVAQTRKRGAQFMQAVTAVYPDITIVVIQDTGWASGPLVKAFVKGMLEARGKATIIDGIEQAYRMMTYEELVGLKQKAASLQTADVYEDLTYGLGIWWDYRAARDMPFNLRHVEKNVRNPKRLEHSLYNALAAADRYAWIYSAGGYLDSVWWHGKFVDGPRWAVHIPETYIDAFRNCRKPHDLAWVPAGKNPQTRFDGAVLVVGDKITGRQENLFTNGDFNVWRNGPDDAPEGWTLVKAGLASGKSARVKRDATSAKIGRYSAQLGMATLGDTGHISLDQPVPASAIAGKTVTFGAWIKQEDPEIGNLEIVGVYQDTKSSVSPPDPGGWRFHTLTAPVPAGQTGQVPFRLRAFVQYSLE